MKKNQWKLVITRNLSFWTQCLSTKGHYYNSKDFGVDKSVELLFIVENSTEVHLFTRPKNLEEYKRSVMKAVSTKAKIEKLKEKYQRYAKELLIAIRKCEKSLTVSNWEKLIKEYQRFTAGLFLTSIIGRSGAELLIVKLKEKGFSETKIPGILAIITYPKKHTPLFDSQLNLLTIGERVQSKTTKDNQINNYLEKWLEEYGHVPVGFCGNSWKLADAKKQLEEVLKKDCKEEKVAIKKNHKKKIDEAKVLLKKINDKEIETLALAVQEGTSLNEFRKDIFSRVSLGLYSVFAHIANFYNFSDWKFCFYLLPEEITSMLKGRKIPVSEIVKKRKVVGMRIATSGDLVFLNDSDLNSFFSHVKLIQGKSKKKNEKVKQIKGLSANNGKVQGIVKVVLGSKDFNKFKTNEILVTAMTSVDFIPIMEKAAAFITNEGGITSHASIVAREMNKPCIIGTKIATKVLKDGDLVEVDANKGVVRVLKR